MLSNATFQAYIGGLKLPRAGAEYLERVRESGSSRRVQSGAVNVTVRFPSAKMAEIRQAESRTIELPTALSFEYDDSVFEYYDQPESIKLLYNSVNGRKNGIMHTPDFLVLTRTGVTFVECKPEEKLGELATVMPNRYQKNGTGQWVCPPGEAMAGILGFSYQVVSSSMISLVTTRNVMFLSDYLAEDAPKTDAEMVRRVQMAVRRHPGLSLKALFAAVDGLTADQAFAILASGAVYFDAAAAPVADQDRVLLFDTIEAAKAYAILSKSNTGANLVTEALKEAQMAIFSRASREDWTVALARYKQLQAPSPDLPKRTLQRLTAQSNEAEKAYGCGLYGLLPRDKNRGNHKSKLPAELLEVVDATIDDHYLTLIQMSTMAVYGILMRSCEQKGLSVPSYQWFCRRVASLDSHRKTKLRQGNRAAIPLEPRPPASIGPRTCDRPFERAHIDHTVLDIEVISEDGKSLGRPWLTVMIDEFSRRISAFYITFNAPSATSALAVLRICVSRFKRLPDCIVVDGGREFASQNFEVLTARYSVRLEKRPPARARYGSVIERMFGTINTQLLYQLAGNTQATKNVRTVTKGNDPKGQALWTLADLDALIERYLYELYDKANHSSLNQSPSEMFANGIEKSGWRKNREINYEEFAMWTYPSTPRGKARVQPRRGVQINYVYYWCEEFRNPDVENTHVDVRFDPFDLGIAFAWVNKQWIKCISSHHHVLKGRSLKELQIAAEELRRSKSLNGRAKLVTAKNLAEFLSTIEPSARQRKQQLKDAGKLEASPGSKPTAAETSAGPNPKRGKAVIPDLDDIPDAKEI